jgi:hypothetical protein
MFGLAHRKSQQDNGVTGGREHATNAVLGSGSAMMKRENYDLDFHVKEVPSTSIFM